MLPKPLALRLLPLVLASCLALPAGASALRWEPAAGGAAIVLPVPAKGDGIVGGTLSCAAQKWTLRLRTERAVSASEARIAIDDTSLTVPARDLPGAVEIALPAEALALLKDGTAVTVTLGDGEAAASARFPLAGSRTAIEATAPLCSPPELPGFDAVRLAPDGAAAEAARAATAEEAALFREATGRDPSLAAAFLAADGGRELLFASLCGSNRYYGETGCKLVGFARETAGAAWQPAYESEGMHLFRDTRRARGGWPDLAAIPFGKPAEPLYWSWGEGAYEPTDEAAIADAPSVIDELRTGTAVE